MKPGALLLLLVAPAFLAGCLDGGGDGNDGSIHGSRDENTVGDVTLTGTLAPGIVSPGENITAEFTLVNAGTNATYTSGGCGTRPWVFEVVAQNGTVVAPLGPDPRCLGQPDREHILQPGKPIGARFGWNATIKWRDDQGTVHAEPAPPGRYALRASAPLTRDGLALAPTVELPFTVRGD